MPIIDVHAHHVPESCLGMTGGPLPADRRVGDITDLARRLSDMDAMGVDVQVMSAWMGFYSRDLETARRHNDALAASVATHPERFVGLAIVPLAEPEHAPRELERAAKELGLRGVEIGTNVLGQNLDGAELGPFFSKAEELSLPIFIHPVNQLGIDRLGSYRLENLIGNVTETAVAAASLIFGGVLDAFPRLTVYLAHGGGSCPYIRGRWDHGWQAQDLKARNTRRPSGLPQEHVLRRADALGRRLGVPGGRRGRGTGDAGDRLPLRDGGAPSGGGHQRSCRPDRRPEALHHERQRRRDVRPLVGAHEEKRT